MNRKDYLGLIFGYVQGSTLSFAREKLAIGAKKYHPLFQPVFLLCGYVHINILKDTLKKKEDSIFVPIQSKKMEADGRNRE